MFRRILLALTLCALLPGCASLTAQDWRDRYEVVVTPEHKGKIRFPSPGTETPADAVPVGDARLVLFGEDVCALEAGGFLVMVMQPCVRLRAEGAEPVE